MGNVDCFGIRRKNFCNFLLFNFVSNENKSEKDDDFLYKLFEELICKKMMKAIAKNPHVFALKS